VRRSTANTVIVFVVCLISGCSGDGQHDKSIDALYMREAGCIAASERFFLYDEAKRHLGHAQDEAAARFERSSKVDKVATWVRVARQVANSKPKAWNADYLTSFCNTKLTNGQFEDAD
jgi:hypothetical protein